MKSAMSFGGTVKAFTGKIHRYNREFTGGVQKIIDDTADVLVKEASRLTPVDTGKASRSWAKSTKLSPSNRGRNRRVHVFNTARTGKGNASGPYYIWFVNNGTRNIAPRRFFEKAVAIAKRYQDRRINNLIKKVDK